MKTTSIPSISALGVLCGLALIPAVLVAANPRPHEARGTIKSVDAATHTLVVAEPKGKSEHKFQWNDQTRFTEHGKAANAADLKAGEHIRLTFKGDGELPTIEHATLAPAKDAKTSSEKS